MTTTLEKNEHISKNASTDELTPGNKSDLYLNWAEDNNALNFRSFGMYHHVSRFLLKVHQATQCHDISHYLNQSLEKCNVLNWADAPNFNHDHACQA